MQIWTMNINDLLILRVQIFARASDGEKKIFVINVKISSAFMFYIVSLDGKIPDVCVSLPFPGSSEQTPSAGCG